MQSCFLQTPQGVLAKKAFALRSTAQSPAGAFKSRRGTELSRAACAWGGERRAGVQPTPLERTRSQARTASSFAPAGKKVLRRVNAENPAGGSCRHWIRSRPIVSGRQIAF